MRPHPKEHGHICPSYSSELGTPLKSQVTYQEAHSSKKACLVAVTSCGSKSHQGQPQVLVAWLPGGQKYPPVRPALCFPEVTCHVGTEGTRGP